MKNWYEIIEPDQDIQEGNFDQSQFAANLDNVASGTASPDYQDAYRFFNKTYLTDGLKNLIDRVHKRLSKGKGDSILNIQTPFGGGKTHSLIALYHYLNSGDEIEDLLPDDIETISAETGVIVGTSFNPAKGNEINGVRAKTFWGILGAQLGGKEGYEFFRENDEAMVPPGERDLSEFLSRHEPVVIMLDEVLQYINKAYNFEATAENQLSEQTLSFCQELTQAISNLDNAVLLATLPASELEDFSTQDTAYFSSLQKVIGRQEGIETPVKGQEIYSIVRKRLFAQHETNSDIRGILEDYMQYYQGFRDNLPAKVGNQTYKEQMEKAYPFHPDLIDILYHRWGTLSKFQRTRGVLRLLGLVVGDLYEREVNTDLILPGHVNLANKEIRRTLIEIVGEEYDSIIDSDIAGPNAKSRSIDAEFKEGRHLAEKISTSIFLYSHSGQSQESSASIEELRLATLHHDQPQALVGDLLQKLENELWYLSEDGTNYRFSHIPNLNRMVVDRKYSFEDDWEDEFEDRLKDKDMLGRDMKVIVWPTNSKDIPDDNQIKLVLLSPDDTKEKTEEWVSNYGDKTRLNANTLVFSAPDHNKLESLKENILERLALEDIKTSFSQEDEEDPQRRQQKEEVEERMRDLNHQFSKDIRNVYRKCLVDGEEIDLGQPTMGGESISRWYQRELKNREKIVEELSPGFIENKLLQNNDQVQAKAIRDQMYKNDNYPMIESDEVIKTAIRQGIQNGVFGLAYKDSEDQWMDIYFQQEQFFDNVPAWDEGEYVVKKELAQNIAQDLSEDEDEGEDIGDIGESDGGNGTENGGEGCDGRDRPDNGDEEEPKVEKFNQLNYTISGISETTITKVIQGVVLSLQEKADDMEMCLDINIESSDGITKSYLENTVRETLFRQLDDEVTVENEELS